MTTDEKNSVDRLHLQGIGYRKIAAELGISQNTVKSYLKRNTKPRSKKEVSGVCKQCGKSIEQRPHKRKKTFCSGSCRSRWWRENTNLSDRTAAVIKRCKGCSKEFVSYQCEKRSFCSRKCYVEAFQKELVIV